ncbi:asparagine synthase-related protein [Novosphingobium malaysiense]|uniref:asparagine synthase-related protein n=1 Tax=Novosphingobium malaysiense TaxID=1348853 RepID=UPI00068C8ADE|nr:asparagine synthase C-terminal domain-containing protein [Novosphingobium malaysiense]
MRYPRYLALAGASDPFGVKREIAQRLEVRCGLKRVLATPRLDVLSNCPAPVLLASDRGAILGPIHARPPSVLAMPCPDEMESALIVSTRGARLIREYWGDYVAFLDNSEAQRAFVLRAPLGHLDCLRCDWRGITLVASDLALLRAATGKAFPADWNAVAAFLASDGLRVHASCREGIEEVLWGERLVISRQGLSREEAWSPWSFAPEPVTWPRAVPDDAGNRFQAAAQQLRETAIAVLGAQARDAGPIVSMLSGGLDSSILAACLAASRCDVTCLNLTTGDSAGDERDHARMVARALDVPLVEAAHDAAHVDLSISHAAGQARPVARGFYQATRQCKAAAARAHGAQVVFDGGGGDNLFCSLQSARPIADRLRVEGPRGGALRTAVSMAQLTETGLPTLLRKAAVQAWLAKPDWPWPRQERFLTRHALDLAGRPAHRWLAAPRACLPGSAAHVALLVAVGNLLETREATVCERAPLMAQPLVELCLSVPSWLWFQGGYNRAVARAAFAPDLPREVAWRRTKGTPDGFVTRLYETNRKALRDLLCEGLLASQGLLDREAVSAVLSRPGPVRGNAHLRLMQVADVEAWLRSLQDEALDNLTNT